MRVKPLVIGAVVVAGLGLVIIALCVLAIGVAIHRSKSPVDAALKRDVKDEWRELNAEAKIEGGDLVITNRDSFTYGGPTVVIVQDGEYVGHYPDIRPGEHARLSFFEFTNSDNQRFPYYTTKPSVVTMTCVWEGRAGRAGWKF